MSTATAGNKRAKKGQKPWYHISNMLWTGMLVVIIGGIFYPLLGLLVMVCFGGAVISGPIAGRWWCGNACPRGNFWDRIVSRFIKKPKMPAWAKNNAVRITVLVLLMAGMTTQIVFAVAGGNGWVGVGRVFWTLLTVTTVIGIFMAMTGHQRAWCKVCPAGTMASWMSKGKKPQLKMDVDNCKHCNACFTVCPMDLEPAEMAAQEGPTDPDCLKCGQCVSRCPINVLSLSKETEEEKVA